MSALLTRQQCFRRLAAYFILALAALLVTPLIGSETLQFKQILNDLKSNQPWGIDTEIFVHQRLPRVVLAFLVGAGLAVVGGVFQVVLRNPLAEPSTLGITAGGTVGAVLAIKLQFLSFTLGPLSSVQIFAMIGSGLTLLLIYVLARRSDGVSMHTLLLTGVTIGICGNAAILFISYLASPNMLVAMNRWMMGGVDVLGFSQLGALFPLLLPGLGLLFILVPSLNHLSLGEEMAMGHGVNVAGVQRVAFLGGGLIIAAVVSLTGPIAFVGLIVPHILRRLSGYNHRVIIPASFFAGGAFLAICDCLARTLIAPTEMPVGIITAITGGPFFIYLLLRRKITQD